MLIKKRPISNSDWWGIPYYTITTNVVFGQERFSKIKVHPDFDKFSEEILLDIMLVASFFFPSFQAKLIFLPILKERNPPNFSIWIYNHQKYTLLSTRSLKTNWISWCPTFFDHHRHSQQSFHSLQTVWFFPFFHLREIWKANHLFFKRFKTCT